MIQNKTVSSPEASWDPAKLHSNSRARGSVSGISIPPGRHRPHHLSRPTWTPNNAPNQTIPCIASWRLPEALMRPVLTRTAVFDSFPCSCWSTGPDWLPTRCDAVHTSYTLCSCVVGLPACPSNAESLPLTFLLVPGCYRASFPAPCPLLPEENARRLFDPDSLSACSVVLFLLMIF